MDLPLKFKAVYYKKGHLWHGEVAVKKLTKAVPGSSAAEAKEWLLKQPIYQIYMPAPSYIPRRKFDVSVPNEVHQIDIMYMPHDKVGKRVYKFCLCVVDIASRYKAAEPLVARTAAAVADGIAKIYAHSPLTYPNLVQIDRGSEFKGDFRRLMEANEVRMRVAISKNHRQQSIVERFNKTLAIALFKVQYVEELATLKTNTEWVKGLQEVVDKINDTPTRLIGMAPSAAIEKKIVEAKPSLPIKNHSSSVLLCGTLVRYLYAPGEAFEGERRRATDPIWSQHVYEISRVSIPTNADYEYDKYTIAAKGPVLYHIDPADPDRSGRSADPAGQSPDQSAKVPEVRRSFVREELQVVRDDRAGQSPQGSSEVQKPQKPQKPQKRGGRASQRSSKD